MKLYPLLSFCTKSTRMEQRQFCKTWNSETARRKGTVSRMWPYNKNKLLFSRIKISYRYAMCFKTFIMAHFIILETILGTFFIPMIAIRENQNHQLSFYFDLLLKLKDCFCCCFFKWISRHSLESQVRLINLF